MHIRCASLCWPYDLSARFVAKYNLEKHPCPGEELTQTLLRCAFTTEDTCGRNALLTDDDASVVRYGAKKLSTDVASVVMYGVSLFCPYTTEGSCGRNAPSTDDASVVRYGAKEPVGGKEDVSETRVRLRLMVFVIVTLPVMVVSLPPLTIWGYIVVVKAVGNASALPLYVSALCIPPLL